jgi:hypothetical protein
MFKEWFGLEFRSRPDIQSGLIWSEIRLIFYPVWSSFSPEIGQNWITSFEIWNLYYFVVQESRI